MVLVGIPTPRRSRDPDRLKGVRKRLCLYPPSVWALTPWQACVVINLRLTTTRPSWRPRACKRPCVILRIILLTSGLLVQIGPLIVMLTRTRPVSPVIVSLCVILPELRLWRIMIVFIRERLTRLERRLLLSMRARSSVTRSIKRRKLTLSPVGVCVKQRPLARRRLPRRTWRWVVARVSITPVLPKFHRLVLFDLRACMLFGLMV